MLFLLKRTWKGALAALAALTALGLGLRGLLGDPPALAVSARTGLLGLGVFAGVLCSDLLLHLLFCLTFGEHYRKRYRELAALFREQSTPAILAGAVLAGVGEELVFRGLSTQPGVLIGAACCFGLFHHVRRSLWPFSLWATWQGLLFALALQATGALFVCMTAHFLHDLAGFVVFRHLNHSAR
jgi:membrane protease YdiL (CAAX protease family)